jgi:multidrug resistance protein
MKLDRSFWVLFFIMVVNAMGFGIIFPVLYPYAKTFGINESQLGWLIACFPLAQLIATPILGKLSDNVGRKPVLLGSLIGTALSFYLFAEAGSIFMLFFARVLDGLTGGNISVAHAVIADSVPKAQRAKAFGLLAAALGIGFLLGPILGGLLGEYQMIAPFWFAAGVSIISVMITWIFLKESNPEEKREKNTHTRFFHKEDFQVVFSRPSLYLTMCIGLITATANFGVFTGVQTFCTDVLQLKTIEMGYLFGLFAVASILTQVAFLKPVLKILPEKALVLSLVTAFAGILMLIAGFTIALFVFSGLFLTYAIFNSARDPLLQSLISESVEQNKQGVMLGINQSAISIGQISGPIIAGYAAKSNVNLPFSIAGGLLVISSLLSIFLYYRSKESNAL